MTDFDCAPSCAQVTGNLPKAMSATVGSSPLPLPALLLGCALVLSLALWCCTVDERPPRFQPLLVVAGFAMTIVWLNLLANEMIALIQVSQP